MYEGAAHVAELVSIPFIAGQWSLRLNTWRRTDSGSSFNPLHCGAVVASSADACDRQGVRDLFQSPSLRGSGRFGGAARRRHGRRMAFQSPSLRGSGRFMELIAAVALAVATFQSPSLRGSGRFGRRRRRRWPLPVGFNPLHCGAVVASRAGSRSGWRPIAVSIPFIAGQWSLRMEAALEARREAEVSIPFIAGQWSLRKPSPYGGKRRHVSIPFIAGQWSLRGPDSLVYGWRRCFNPLHCGAVVASFNHKHAQVLNGQVSIPFIAGQWSLPALAVWRAQREAEVSIPFIAGQWSLPAPGCAADASMEGFQSPSLRGSGRFPRATSACDLIVQFQSPSLRGSGRFARAWARSRSASAFCFNPLHCGAVVASAQRLENQLEALARFNPLHCGAVVASKHGRGRRPRHGPVSIPFIAGQWSLPRESLHVSD